MTETLLNDVQICTAFRGSTKFASGPLTEVVLKAKATIDADASAQIIIFDDANARRVEVDFRGSADEMLARLAQAAPPQNHERPTHIAEPAQRGTARGPGRPKLGVVAREVTLLPRHWDWLRSQPGGASVTLRKLVEAARRADPEGDMRRKARDRTYGFMTAMAGDEPGFEEATRALYAGDGARFTENTEAWPQDVRDHARMLAQGAF